MNGPGKPGAGSRVLAWMLKKPPVIRREALLLSKREGSRYRLALMEAAIWGAVRPYSARTSVALPD